MSAVSLINGHLDDTSVKSLKPCPFCGNRNVSLVTENVDFSYGLLDYAEFKVVCSTTSHGCGAMSRKCESKEQTIKAWNRRVGDV